VTPILPRRPRPTDDDLELELESELVDIVDDPPTEEVPVLEPPAPPPPRYVVGPAVVTLLEVVGGGAVAGLAATLAGLVDALVEADAAAAVAGEDGVAPPRTAVAVHGAVLSLVTPASVDEVPAVLVRHGRLASRALVAGLDARLTLRGAVAWGEVATGAGLLLGSALDEALAWGALDHLGVRLAPSAALATSGAGVPTPAGWIGVEDRTLLRWSDDPRAVERALAGLGRFGEVDVARSARTLAFLRSAVVT
jgi:hypothetical protein